MDQVKIDSLLPSEMASQAESIGVVKAKMPLAKTLVLAVLAGAFIAFGSVFFTTVTAASTMSYGVTRLLGGLCFSLGLILVIIGGAELFTGNNLIIMAWANKKVSTMQLLRNWCLVYLGNFVGAFFIVVLMLFAKQYQAASGMVGINMLNIAKTKCELDFMQAVALGVLCNILVCLAVWLCFSSKSIAGKIIAILFPISAFVACGFEHSIANMYFVPNAIFTLNQHDDKQLALIAQSGTDYSSITWTNFFMNNLLPVTIGNIFGGAVLVGLVYWFVYLRNNKSQ
ncbi:MAG: formate transporter FocA [Bacteroidetes bacterium]|nr:formate transporter FocA [Bacteroidota bacterium]